MPKFQTIILLFGAGEDCFLHLYFVCVMKYLAGNSCVCVHPEMPEKILNWICTVLYEIISALN